MFAQLIILLKCLSCAIVLHLRVESLIRSPILNLIFTAAEVDCCLLRPYLYMQLFAKHMIKIISYLLNNPTEGLPCWSREADTMLSNARGMGSIPGWGATVKKNKT